jgi:exodeoxyribonuclease VII small subunit
MKRKGTETDQGAGTEALSFEQMMERLEQLVSHLERGDLSLEESIHSFEEGIKLVKQCTAVLGQAEKRIQSLTQEGAALAETPPVIGGGGEEEEEERGDGELPF